MSAADSARAMMDVRHGPLCSACGETTIVSRGQAVCPKCIPAGATIDEIAIDRNSASHTNQQSRDSHRASVISATTSELLLIRNRVEFLLRRMGAVALDHAEYAAVLNAVRMGVEIDQTQQPPRLGRVLMDFAPVARVQDAGSENRPTGTKGGA